MRSISLPGLVLWLPLGSPAACLKHIALNLNMLPISLTLHGVVQPDNAWLKDFPECTTLRSHCRRRRLQRSILKPPYPLSFPFPHSQPYTSRHPLSNAPATGIRGPQVTPQSSFGRFIAFYNLCSLLLHCHAPSHSYTGVVVTSLLLFSKCSSTAEYIQSKYRSPSLLQAHLVSWCHFFLTEFHTHLVASVLPGHCCIVMCHCAVIYCILS